jgi:hypothetical protein
MLVSRGQQGVILFALVEPLRHPGGVLVLDSMNHYGNNCYGAKHLARFRDMQALDILKRSAGLPRRQAVLLYRLITGHVPLQKHRWVIAKADSLTCLFCEKVPETVAHYILHCPVHAAARHHTSPLGRDARVLERLFSEPHA